MNEKHNSKKSQVSVYDIISLKLDEKVQHEVGGLYQNLKSIIGPAPKLHDTGLLVKGEVFNIHLKNCNHFGKLLSGACTTNLSTKNWDIGFTETFAQFIHYSFGISWEPRLNQSRYFTLSNYSTSVLEKSINYIIMITSQEDKDKEKYRVSKKSECCWSPKILTKIECCGAKYSHNMTWKRHSWY